MENSDNHGTRQLHWWERRQLEDNGCRCADWDRVSVSDDTDLTLIRDVEFRGNVDIGPLRRNVDSPESGIEHTVIEDCRLGADVCIRRVRESLRGYTVGHGARIVDVGLVEYEREASCGIGLQVSVLDETGSRPVILFPGLSAQIAMLMARMPHWTAEHLKPILDSWIETLSYGAVIGENASIERTAHIRNVFVDREVIIDGATRLHTGCIINNAPAGRCMARVGAGVNADGFLIEDGTVLSGCILHNVFVGQGAVLADGLSAHDSLFFANCTCHNGETCALFAGPYTTTMHKSTLLIGAQTQFMNAGSASNQSNHLYKMGPVHWGIMERGVKTSSFSYVMWGAKIGAFSLVVGSHKMHPDSSDFPFSYLFGDERGGTIVVPGIMLRSSGLLRDEKKWPLRERRVRRLPLHDRIQFEVLNPVTVGAMARALPLIDELRRRPADDDRFVRFKGMKLRVSNLERAHHLYTLGICKYLKLKLGNAPFPACPDTGDAPEAWLDLAGQFVPEQVVRQILRQSSLADITRMLDYCFEHFTELEMKWIACALKDWGLRPRAEIDTYAAEFDRLVDEDRRDYLQLIADENQMLSLLSRE